MQELQELQEVEARLDVVERRSHRLMLAGFALAGMATAAFFVWRGRRRVAALAASLVGRHRPRLRVVRSDGRPSTRRGAAKKSAPRRKKTD